MIPDPLLSKLSLVVFMWLCIMLYGPLDRYAR
jgi:hypothetical protein